MTLLLVGLMLIGMTACSSSQTSTKDKKTDPTSGTPQEITMQLVTWNAEVPVENCTLYKEIEEELNIKLNINWVLAANFMNQIPLAFPLQTQAHRLRLRTAGLDADYNEFCKGRDIQRHYGVYWNEDGQEKHNEDEA